MVIEMYKINFEDVKPKLKEIDYGLIKFVPLIRFVKTNRLSNQLIDSFLDRQNGLRFVLLISSYTFVFIA